MFLYSDVFLYLKVVLMLGSSVGPDEMQLCGAFHLGLHCLPKYPFRGFQYTKIYVPIYMYHLHLLTNHIGCNLTYKLYCYMTGENPVS